MAKAKRIIRVYLDPVANTFNIWWDNPKKAYSSEEVDSPFSNDVIVKDRQGRPISLEVIGIFPSELNVAKYLGKYAGIKNKTPFLLEAST